MPIAGSIVASTRKETLGWNQAHVTWTHSWSTSVGLRAPPVAMQKGGKSLIAWNRVTNQTGEKNRYHQALVEYI